MNGIHEHPTWEQLAQLAESGHESVSSEVVSHLSVCATCMADYAEAVRQLDRELAGVVHAGVPVTSHSRRRMSPAPRRKSRLVLWAGGLAAAVVALVVILPLGPSSFDPDDPRNLVQTQLAELSRSGPVYPGVRELSSEGITQYRAGPEAGADPELADRWSARFLEEPADAEAAYWLAAHHLANGRLQSADDVLRRALAKSDEKTDLRHLEAITAYRRDQLDRAESVLQRILQDHPDDKLARFNLALVQCEMRRCEDARTVFEELAEDDESSALQQRARTWIDESTN